METKEENICVKKILKDAGRLELKRAN